MCTAVIAFTVEDDHLKHLAIDVESLVGMYEYI